MDSGRSTIDLSKGQNEWEPSWVSLDNTAMASRGVTVCLTTVGLHEMRTNPASVKRQVAHPCSRCASNHVPCCGVVNVVGPSQGYEDIHVQEGSHGHWLKEW